MARPKVYDDSLRLRLLDRAGEVLSDEGPAALSLRRLAADVGTSTTAVYSLFGNKSALVGALFVEAFRRFGRRLDAVARTDDPLDDLFRLALAYRDSALADPHLYAVMFGRPVPGFEPDERAAAEASGTMQPLLDMVRAGIDGAVLTGDPWSIAVALWAQVHGLVSLELAGCLPDEYDTDAGYRQAVAALVAGWRRPAGSADQTAPY